MLEVSGSDSHAWNRVIKAGYVRCVGAEQWGLGRVQNSGGLIEISVYTKVQTVPGQGPKVRILTNMLPVSCRKTCQMFATAVFQLLSRKLAGLASCKMGMPSDSTINLGCFPGSALIRSWDRLDVASYSAKVGPCVFVPACHLSTRHKSPKWAQ